jgi:hypothetical protein
VLRDGSVFSEQFLPAQRDYTIPKEVEEEKELCSESCICAEPSMEVLSDGVRRFTMEEIVTYAKENLSLDKSVYIQAMLYSLLRKDGTQEEREMVNSITEYIVNRDKPDPQHVEHQTVIPKVEHYYDKVDKVENKFPPMGDPNKLIE